MSFNIKEIIKDNEVRFVKYRQGFFYYKILVTMPIGLGDAFKNYQWHTFPVPLDDIGDATLPYSDKAIMFMRYIRKAIEEGTFVPKQD